MNTTQLTVWGFIFEVAKPFRWLLAALLAASLVWSVELSVGPYLIKIMLDRIPGLEPSQALQTLWGPAALYITLSLLVVGMFRINDWVTLHWEPNLKKHIGMIFMERMMEQSHQFYQNHFTGGLISRVNDLMKAVPTILENLIHVFISHILAVCIAICTVWQVKPRFAIALAIWIGVFLLGSLQFAKMAKGLADNAAMVRSSLFGHIADIMSNMMNVRLFAAKSSEKSYLRQTFEQFVKAEQKRDWFFMRMYTFQGGSFSLFQAVCLWWLITGLESSSITPGDFALILAVNTALIDALWDLAKDIREFAEAWGNVSQGIRVLNTSIEIEDNPSAPELVATKGEIVFDHVSFAYKDNEPLFQDMSVKIPAGQKVGLVGYSGSGKTSFVSLILRLYDVVSGRILIDDQDIREVMLDSLRRGIAMIPQDPSLFNRTLMDNIRYGSQVSSEYEAIKAAMDAHAHDFISQLPLRYKGLVGERGIKLSGGERQRVAIARAFLKKAKIVILDEATSQLDSVTEHKIQESLWKLMKGKTTLVIAHRLSTLLHMDRILVFSQGNIVQDGTHQDLLNQEGLYKILWEAQVGGFLPDVRTKVVSAREAG